MLKLLSKQVTSAERYTIACNFKTKSMFGNQNASILPITLKIQYVTLKTC
jgi:hypothetical protein